MLFLRLRVRRQKELKYCHDGLSHRWSVFETAILWQAWDCAGTSWKPGAMKCVHGDWSLP